MTDALLAIDRALDGRCPCGAPPAPGSAYCGEDCTPTHIAGDTDTSDAGRYGAQSTAMRWRPDLVAAVDDSRRRLIGEFHRGDLTAHVYEYADGNSLHFRLDDGFRFVGCDVDGTTSVAGHRNGVWQRLERDLRNSRHRETGAGPWTDVLPSAPRQTPEPWPRRCLHCGERTEPCPSTRELWSDRRRPDRRYLGSERCDACGSCGRAFPGPSLQVVRIGDPPAFRMRIGAVGRHYQFRGHELTREIDPVDLIQRRLERMEADLLFAYAHANFSRPDVSEWVQAYTESLIRTPTIPHGSRE